MRSKLVRTHAAAMMSMSKEALIQSLIQSWDRIDKLEADRADDGYENIPSDFDPCQFQN